MATRRKLSRYVRRSRLERREELEAKTASLIEILLREHDPTLQAPGIKTASHLAAVIAAQIAVQPQSVQRSMNSLDDYLTEMATDFVVAVVDAAKSNRAYGIRRFQAAAPSRPDGVPLPDDWAGPVAGSTLIERHFGISRSTLHRWHKRGECVALNAKTSKKAVFPLKQFLDGRPVDGLAAAITAFGNQRDAWQWLVTPREDLDGRLPIDLLIEGRQDLVTNLVCNFRN
ncbi:DUF2384 domain-containing protein [Aquamicrobium lusatiense]|uniref:antitoxin Xre/MbcA/ParS-like domain-containing protein n=1 Tax=Aquamicrobium lusatiense TaxID=89772 RepID=UPI00245741EE|nr:antitoxin Xre/MbcA/ParS toxin-binding domain-containing protein [Aquamicrobium lusatiense]MDH4992044.1 DUF2384 domain-containing protein [Aquamicrobium lusatiense]